MRLGFFAQIINVAAAAPTTAPREPQRKMEIKKDTKQKRRKSRGSFLGSPKSKEPARGHTTHIATPKSSPFPKKSVEPAPTPCWSRNDALRPNACWIK